MVRVRSVDAEGIWESPRCLWPAPSAVQRKPYFSSSNIDMLYPQMLPLFH